MTPALAAAFKLSTFLPTHTHYWQAPVRKKKKLPKSYWREAKRRLRARNRS